jgi:2-methylcitrate dehydratase PrpD
MLKAMVLGYDVCCRLTKSLHAYDFRVQGHSSHTFGPNFGAAAAAGALASVNSEQARYLMSYAAQQASGVSSWMRDKDHIEKAFDFGGMAARNGVTSAIMVSLGFTGVDDVFSGERNFYVAYGKDPIIMELATDLGTRYEIMQTSIKRWTVGSPIQAPLDSLDILIRNHNFELSDISHIKVIIPHESLTIVNNREMPEICIQHLCALMLIDGNMNFAKAHDRLRMRDPEVLRIRELIELSASDELSKQMPTRQGIVEIHLKNGKTLREYTQAVRGTPLNPMSQEELDHKCIELMDPVLGKSTASTICKAVWELERFKSAREFTQILRKH